MNARPTRPEAYVPPEVTRAATVARLSARFGVPVWWGQATRRWWALLPDGGRGRLIEAATPQELAAAISRARTWSRPWRAGQEPGSRHSR